MITYIELVEFYWLGLFCIYFVVFMKLKLMITGNIWKLSTTYTYEPINNPIYFNLYS